MDSNGWTIRSITRKAGVEGSGGFCAPVAVSRVLSADAADADEVADWLPEVVELMEDTGKLDGGTWYAGFRGKQTRDLLDGLGVSYRDEHYYGVAPEEGNPYGRGRKCVDWVQRDSGDWKHVTMYKEDFAEYDRRYDCPTVAQWLRDHPDVKALISVRNHLGYVENGRAFDLQPRHRVDRAFIIED